VCRGSGGIERGVVDVKSWWREDRGAFWPISLIEVPEYYFVERRDTVVITKVQDLYFPKNLFILHGKVNVVALCHSHTRHRHGRK
jgi:hypothetical protein